MDLLPGWVLRDRKHMVDRSDRPSHHPYSWETSPFGWIRVSYWTRGLDADFVDGEMRHDVTIHAARALPVAVEWVTNLNSAIRWAEISIPVDRALRSGAAIQVIP